MRILHIHQDYPDGSPFPSTQAVENLIHASEKKNSIIKHYVVSINRTNNPFKISIKPFNKGLSIVYWALPLPFIYVPIIYLWSLIIQYYLRKHKFDAVHGHKLTTEGIFAYFISKKNKIPLLISVRGGSDLRNIKRLWDIIWLFRKVYNHANHIFWVSPWAKSFIEKTLHCSNINQSAFPNICHIECMYNREINISRNKYCTVMSYHQMKRKGLIPLIDAIALLKEEGINIELDIIGGGKTDSLSIIEERIANLGLEQQISVLGALPHQEVLTILSNAKAFLLPSLNETFGMAYIEALACGSPILFMADTGIDGYFKANEVGVRLEDQHSKSIKNGIIFLEKEHDKLIYSVFNLSKSGELTKFTSPYLGQIYNQCLERIIK